jgi:hypothetical protein
VHGESFPDGGLAGGPDRRCFTLPVSSPLTMKRLSSTAMTAGMAMAMMPAALINENGTTCRPCREAITTVSGSVESSLESTRGNRNCPHANRKVMIAVETMPGQASGMTTWRRTCIRPAPSIDAASSIATGRLDM